MLPAYRYMDPHCSSSPYQRESCSYPRQYCPSWEVMPSQMKTDPLKYPSVFVPPTSNGNIFYPYMGDHSGCCYHSCPPGYYNLRPQLLHVQPPPQLYYHGPYAPYPDTYPAYFIPPPHYSVDQARYDYDKARNHCCGCPNHTCHLRDDSSPMIEDKKAEKVQDGDSSGSISLPNYPAPVAWFPTSSINGREDDKAAQPQSGYWNGWMPLDINSLKASRQEDDGKKTQQDEGGLAQKQLPLPFIWMPAYDEPEGVEKDLKETIPKSMNVWPSTFKILPSKFLENEDQGKRSKAAQEELSSQIQPEAPVEKERKTKTIPVKQSEERNQEEASIVEKQEEKVDEKKATSYEKEKEESEANKASKKKQSSPVRSSKLPPVCLRVDPLPRKKTSNGTSRSPSPPGLKDKRNLRRDEEQSARKERREEISEKIIPVVDVKDDDTSNQVEKEQKYQKNIPITCLGGLSKESLSQETARAHDRLTVQDVIQGTEVGGRNYSEGKRFAGAECEHNIEVDQVRGNKGSDVKMSVEAECQKIHGDKEPVESSENKEVKERKERKRDLSQTDAAVIIQSAYRGFEVRRWKPLEKLQKIAKIRGQAGTIRSQVQSIEASPEELDVKQRMVIGEAIMNLLLQLDTVQGLHPSVRDIRKTVARELVCLQEKFDSLVSRVAEVHEPAKVEKETEATDGEAAHVGSSAGVSKDSSEQKIGPTGNAAEPVVQDVQILDLPTNNDITLNASHLPGEAAPMQEPVQPAEDKPHSEELDTPDRETCAASWTLASEPASEKGVNLSLATEPTSEQVTNLTLATKLAPGQGIEQSAEEYGSSEGLSSEVRKSDCKEKRLVDITGGEGSGYSEEKYHVAGCSFSESWESDFKEKKVEDTVVENAAGWDASGDDSLRVPNGICEKEESVVRTDEEVDRLSSGDATLGLDMKDHLKPLQEAWYQEHEAAPFDLRAEADVHARQKSSKHPVQSLEEGSKMGEGAFEKTEEDKLVLDAGESVVCVADENTSENTYGAGLSLEQKEERENVLDEISLVAAVDDGGDMLGQAIGNDDKGGEDVLGSEIAVQTDDVKESRVEDLEVTAAKNGSCFTGASTEENGLKGFAAEIGDPTIDVLLPMDGDPASEGEQGKCGLNISEDSPSFPAPTPVGTSEESAHMDESPPRTSTSADVIKEERKLVEENEKLTEMLEKLLEAGKEQLEAISNLNGRVKDLERKLAQEKKKKKSLKVKRNRILHKLQSC